MFLSSFRCCGIFNTTTSWRGILLISLVSRNILAASSQAVGTTNLNTRRAISLVKCYVEISSCQRCKETSSLVYIDIMGLICGRKHGIIWADDSGRKADSCKLKLYSDCNQRPRSFSTVKFLLYDPVFQKSSLLKWC